MAVATVGTMLDSAKEFEVVLERFLAQIRDEGKDDKTRLLTYYLVRFKRHLPDTLKNFTEDQIARIRAIPIRVIDSEFDAERCFAGRDLSEHASAGELLETAIELIDILLSFYEWLLYQPTSGEARDLLVRLVKTEEKGRETLRKIQGDERL